MKDTQKRFIVILTLLICVSFVLPGVSAWAENIGTYPLGEEMGWIQFYSSGLPIINCVPYSGALPSAVEMYWDADGVYLTGVPSTIGSFIAEYLVFTEEGASYANVSFTVEKKVPVNQDLVITKSPTGEKVEVGGAAKFVARAQNAERIVWRIVSNDTTNTVKASEASAYFPGLQVSGLDSATLVLSNIPKSMDGWRVEAQFWNGKKHAESMGAEITIVDSQGVPVRTQNVPSPTPAPVPEFVFQPTMAPSVGLNDMPVSNEGRTANISIQPQSVELNPGDSYTLSVIATSPNNGTLSYQWYSSATDNRSAALPIGGAQDASYTINQAAGTAYYWVAVWNTKDGARSQAVYSEPAEVRIAVPATPTPIPTPSTTPVPTPVPRSATPANISFQLVLFGIIGVLALIALIGVVIYLRADAKQKAAEEEEERERNQK